jgi:DNA-binding CsgD family transcriptional regulator
MKDRYIKLSAARRTLERLKVPKELLASSDYIPPPACNDRNRSSVTASICGDPPSWRSALGGYEQVGVYRPRGPQGWEGNDERLPKPRGRPPGTPQMPLRERFGLTPKEFIIANHLAAGGSSRGAGEKFGVSYDCIRSHMKHIFEKTNTHRKDDLAALFRSV